MANDDDFNWNHGIALANTKDYRGAEEAFNNVQSDNYRADPVFLSWLARVYIMIGKPQNAWELYESMSPTNNFAFLVMIANDCYKMGHFFWALRAFDNLEKFDADEQ